MKVYLDYVFFVNFLFDFILLFGINYVLARNATIKKQVLGSLIGAASTFIVFINISSFLFFILKLLSGIIMLIATFNFKDVKYTLINFIYLMLLSIILGGFFYLINIEVGYEHIGIQFINKDISLNILIVLLFSILMIILLIKLFNNHKQNISLYHEVDLYINEKVFHLKGYLDTGNNMYDPYKGRPILILNKSFNIDKNPYLLVPFNTVKDKGIMKCFTPDRVYIKDLGDISNCLVGISDSNINISGVDIILHKKLWKGNL